MTSIVTVLPCSLVQFGGRLKTWEEPLSKDACMNTRRCRVRSSRNLDPYNWRRLAQRDGVLQTVCRCDPNAQ